MTVSTQIRPARPDDAPLAAAAFRLSMNGMTEHLFGVNGHRTEIALMRLFSRNAGRFGYGVASVAEWYQRPLGMLVAFPGADVNRLGFAVAKYLPFALGWNLFGFVLRSLAYTNIKEAEADEYLVSNLAVLPAAQGQGLGSHLLDYADEQARARGFAKVALLVSPDNAAALRLYEKHGYKIVETKHDKNPFASYHRMLKKLNIGN